MDYHCSISITQWTQHLYCLSHISETAQYRSVIINHTTTMTYFGNHNGTNKYCTSHNALHGVPLINFVLHVYTFTETIHYFKDAD